MKIQDESGDKKFFTIIPNYILNHSTLYDRELYIQMKRIAGETGTCWTSRNTLAKKCGISARRLDKSLKYLIAHQWIKISGKKFMSTIGGKQEVKIYRICDLWNLNNSFYQESQRGSTENHTFDQRGSTDESKGVAPGAHKEEPIQEDKVSLEKIEEIKKDINKKLRIKPKQL